MKHLRHRLPLFVILAVPFITLSCGSITSPNQGLNLIASISQQTSSSITFRVGVENTGSKTETLNFRDSQFFDIEVKDLSGRLVWSWSNGGGFLDVVWALELAPGESSAHETVWNLAGNDQKPLSHGFYTAKIYITSSPREEGLSPVIHLTI
jgi:hypothetical protein